MLDKDKLFEANLFERERFCSRSTISTGWERKHPVLRIPHVGKTAGIETRSTACPRSNGERSQLDQMGRGRWVL